MTWSAETLVEELAGAMGRERFLAEAWGRRGCHLPGPPERFAGLLDRAGFERLAPRARCDDFALRVPQRRRVRRIRRCRPLCHITSKASWL